MSGWIPFLTCLLLHILTFMVLVFIRLNSIHTCIKKYVKNDKSTFVQLLFCGGLI